MGTFKVKAKIWSILDRANEAGVELVVDSGSTYTVLPRSLLRKLKVKPVRTVRLKLADSRVVEKSLGEVGIMINEYAASATPVVFGNEDVYLLGAVTMEQLSLAPDPVKKTLVPVEALLMLLRLLNTL